ncbi:restriction endonuclease [Streptomyces violaceorubidus]|uniref:Restriction endonuclease n=1 Tax=Streptomyces violaceorubidus TaxID=284042 RepID=A0ABV1T1T8_9ACTN
MARQLFETIGMEAWNTQASKDEGVDAVGVSKDPVFSGECIIQAKRYSKLVGVESVQALAGVVEHKRAAKGILITTSWFGRASHDFARQHGRLQLIEGPELKYLIKEHLGKDVIPGVVPPKRPRRAENGRPRPQWSRVLGRLWAVRGSSTVANDDPRRPPGARGHYH